MELAFVGDIMTFGCCRFGPFFIICLKQKKQKKRERERIGDAVYVWPRKLIDVGLFLVFVLYSLQPFTMLMNLSLLLIYLMVWWLENWELKVKKKKKNVAGCNVVSTLIDTSLLLLLFYQLDCIHMFWVCVPSVIYIYIYI